MPSSASAVAPSASVATPRPGFVPGPTYAEMLDPRTAAPEWRERAAAARAQELDPANLFNITWRTGAGTIRHVVLPPALTGVKANIIVLLGCAYPSGSHKVGPAYSTLAENEALGRISPEMTMVGPSTGNFGIGVTYVSSLKGYRSLVVMPEGMSAERYERIKRYDGALDLTPGSESDVILVLERVEEIKRDPKNFILAQFELMPNYRFHRHVTGGSALEAAAGVGNGRVAAFVSAPGSAGTIAAGDAIKAQFPQAQVVAVEPAECSTLFDGGMGSHRIEGIGDKMVVLIHNVLQTDHIMKVHDDDTVKGLRVLNEGREYLRAAFGGGHSEGSAEEAGAAFGACDPGAGGRCARCEGLAASGQFDTFEQCFGISGVCNILGAIRTAHHLGLGKGENVVTIATDGFDRYPSVMAELAERTGAGAARGAGGEHLAQWAAEIFGAGGYRASDFLDVRGAAQKQRLFDAKEDVWTRFGYGIDYLNQMKYQGFWEAEYALLGERDAAIREYRGF